MLAPRGLTLVACSLKSLALDAWIAVVPAPLIVDPVYDVVVLSMSWHLALLPNDRGQRSHNRNLQVDLLPPSRSRHKLLF